MRDEGRTFSFRRSIALAVTLGLHAGALLLLTRPLPPEPAGQAVVDPVPGDDWVAVEIGPWDEPPPRSAPALPVVSTGAGRPAARSRMERRTRVPAALVRSASSPPAQALGTADAAGDPGTLRPGQGLRAHDGMARPQLPYEPLYGGGPRAATADFHTPGDGSEDDVFYRPPALEPRTTRFAKAWRGDATLLDEWLGTLIEATSGEVSVPLNPKFNLVCRGSLAGLGGECRILRNAGSGVIVERPPPAPWERSTRAQCAELREGLARATDEDEVLRLLERLSALCTGNGEARREAGLPVER